MHIGALSPETLNFGANGRCVLQNVLVEDAVEVIFQVLVDRINLHLFLCLHVNLGVLFSNREILEVKFGCYEASSCKYFFLIRHLLQMEQIGLIFDHVLTASGAYLAAVVGSIHGVVGGSSPIDL